MKKSTVSKAVLLAGLAFSASSYADISTRFRTGAAVMGSYEVSTDGVVFGGIPLAYQADYVAIPVGVTVLFNSSLYADLAYQSSSGDATFDWSRENPNFSRTEVTATIGARMQNFSLFLGYKQGVTKTDWPTGYAPDEFETAGLVFGAGYSIPLKNSALSFTGGLGSLAGTYTYAPGKSIETDAALGYSMGVGYNYVLGKNWSVGADYKWNLYSYEYLDATIDEEFSQATINVALSF